MDNNNNTRMILGMVAAAAVGVAIGMLLAPEKGSDLRKSLKDAIGDLGDFVGEGREKLMGIADNIRDTTEDLKHDVQTTVDHGKKVVS